MERTSRPPEDDCISAISPVRELQTERERSTYAFSKHLDQQQQHLHVHHGCQHVVPPVVVPHQHHQHVHWPGRRCVSVGPSIGVRTHNSGGIFVNTVSRVGSVVRSPSSGSANTPLVAALLRPHHHIQQSPGAAVNGSSHVHHHGCGHHQRHTSSQVSGAVEGVNTVVHTHCGRCGCRGRSASFTPLRARGNSTNTSTTQLNGMPRDQPNFASPAPIQPSSLDTDVAKKHHIVSSSGTTTNINENDAPHPTARGAINNSNSERQKQRAERDRRRIERSSGAAHISSSSQQIRTVRSSQNHRASTTVKQE